MKVITNVSEWERTCIKLKTGSPAVVPNIVDPARAVRLVLSWCRPEGY